MQDAAPMVIERFLPFARNELRPSLPFVRHLTGDQVIAQGMGGAA